MICYDLAAHLAGGGGVQHAISRTIFLSFKSAPAQVRHSVSHMAAGQDLDSPDRHRSDSYSNSARTKTDNGTENTFGDTERVWTFIPTPERTAVYQLVPFVYSWVSRITTGEHSNQSQKYACVDTKEHAVFGPSVGSKVGVFFFLTSANSAETPTIFSSKLIFATCVR